MKNRGLIQKRIVELRKELTSLERQLSLGADNKLRKKLSKVDLWEVSWEPPKPRIIMATDMTEAIYWGEADAGPGKVRAQRYEGGFIKASGIEETDEVFDLLEELGIDAKEFKAQFLSKRLPQEESE